MHADPRPANRSHPRRSLHLLECGSGNIFNATPAIGDRIPDCALVLAWSALRVLGSFTGSDRTRKPMGRAECTAHHKETKRASE